ncbi:MAG: type II secretion system secretin GspD [Thiobacillaceae bacterium]|jgi:general secretion pathway protein D|nr:type II secretion system secretin GspD [Thiobacillaceae bacterium]
MSASIRGLYVFMLALSIFWAGAAGAAKEPPKGWITLNFVNADIHSVIQAMSEMTGRTFVVDPRVKGTLRITSPRPVSPSVAYDIVLSALRMQGYAAIQSDGVVRIVPEADAKFHATTSTGKSRGKRAGGEMVTRVFSLRHESAPQLQAALRSLVGPNGTFSADASTNTLIVTDYADNLASLEQVIASLDVPSVDEPVLIPLRYVSAKELAALVTRVFAPMPGQAPGGGIDLLQIAVDDRSNSLIIRGRDRSLVGKVQNLAATLDVPTPVAGNVHVIYLKNAQAVEVAKTLRNILASDTGSVTQTAAAQPATTQLATAAAAASQDLGPGMVQADAGSNALIITAPEAVFANLKAVVEKLDVRRAQVLIEALIVEVSADKAAEFGIQWIGAGTVSSDNTLGGLFGNSTPATNIGVLAAAASSGTTAGLLGIASGLTVGFLKGESFGVLARALETEAGGNILSTPSLLTLDNEEAKISVGSNVAFATGSFTTPASASDGLSNPFTTFERQDVGLTLKVKPQISEGGTVRMVISQEVSQLRPAPGTDPTLASTDKRSIDSTVLVDDGQVVVLGGLIQDQMTDGEDSVPFLGDLPIVGQLFRYSNRKRTKTNLMVFLRPMIVRTAADAAAVTSPRYDYILGQEKSLAPGRKFMLPDVSTPLISDHLYLGGTPPSQDNAAVPPTPVAP